MTESKPTQELKPCPFCGGPAEMRSWDYPYVRFQVRCSKCKAHARARMAEKTEAAAAWNTRSGDATELLRKGQAVRYKAHGFDWYATVVDPDVEGWVEIKFRSDGSTAIVRPSHLEGEA